MRRGRTLPASSSRRSGSVQPVTDYLASERSGLPFERRVADAYVTLGYHVTHNVQLPGKQVDLLAVREVDGAPRIVLAVECKSAAARIGSADVHAFVAAVATHREASLVTGGVMVSASGFTKDARAAGTQLSYITLLTWDELTTMVFDVKHQMRALVSDYESSSIHRAYVHLGIELVTWATGLPAIGDDATLESLIRQWLHPAYGRDGGATFILADFGAGKTTLLRHLEYQVAQAHLLGVESRVPLFVPLRGYRSSQDLSTLLRASYRDIYYRDLPEQLIWSRLNDGQFCVLLDGFDEMAERSDVHRRTELFHELLRVVRTPSPTMITSRPSYFIERGELESLLLLLQHNEAALTAPQGDQSTTAAITDKLRRRLIDRHRERAPGRGAHEPLRPRIVKVVRLLPLDRRAIREYLRHRAAELELVGATPESVIAFIERTYDLMDLATRPLLLALIVDSVLEGGLNLADVGTKIGASGLYEIYTATKLSLDLGKVPGPRQGLGIDVRRLLAERLATEMHRADVLELEFKQLIEDLASTDPDGALSNALAASGLSLSEIATDFATCSFITLNDDGSCRFVHKSFRGFFVARTLRAELAKRSAVLSPEPMDWEVLYFLGGFAIADRRVAERLWAMFRQAGAESPHLRRNALLAFLYTSPTHERHQIARAIIATAEFGQLTLRHSRMDHVIWRQLTIRKLAVEMLTWTNVRMEDVNIGDFMTGPGRLELSMHTSSVERLAMSETVCTLNVTDSEIDLLTAADTTARVGLRNARVPRLQIANSSLCISASTAEEGSAEPEHFDAVSIDRSAVDFGDRAAPLVGASCSSVRYRGQPSDVAGWTLNESVVVCTCDVAPRSGRPVAGAAKGDRRSVVVTTRHTRWAWPLAEAIRGGIFGYLGDRLLPSLLARRASAWGVVEAQALLLARPLARAAHGYRYGDILLVSEDWLASEWQEGGRLSTIRELVNLVHDDPPAAADTGAISDLLDAVRRQYDVLVGDDWVDVAGLKPKRPEAKPKQRP